MLSTCLLDCSVVMKAKTVTGFVATNQGDQLSVILWEEAGRGDVSSKRKRRHFTAGASVKGGRKRSRLDASRRQTSESH